MNAGQDRVAQGRAGNMQGRAEQGRVEQGRTGDKLSIYVNLGQGKARQARAR